MYVIAWKSKITGYSGRGTHSFPNMKIINYYIDRSNKKYPDIYHYVIEDLYAPKLKIYNTDSLNFSNFYKKDCDTIKFSNLEDQLNLQYIVPKRFYLNKSKFINYNF